MYLGHFLSDLYFGYRSSGDINNKTLMLQEEGNFFLNNQLLCDVQYRAFIAMY